MAFAIIVLLSFSHPLGASSLHCFLKSFSSFHHMHIPHPDPINLHLHSFFPCSSCRPSCAVLRALVHFCIVTPICVPIPLSLSYGSRPGPSPLTTFDPHDLTLGDEGNTFLLSLPLLLRGKKKQKMYEKCVFVGQVKNVSRLSFTNTSRWKCCRMCRVSRHHSVDIPIVWHFEGFQRSTVYDLILSWNVCYIYCCVFNVSNEHCMLFLFTVLPLQICCTAMPFLLRTLFLADNLSHIYASFIMTNDRFVYFSSQIFKVKPTLRCHYFLSLRLCSGFYFDLSLPLTSRCVVSIGKSVKAKFTRERK